MSDRNRPRPQTEASPTSGSTEIEIVKMKAKNLIKLHAYMHERRPFTGQKHAIQKLALGW
jgi:hypothetical protein